MPMFRSLYWYFVCTYLKEGNKLVLLALLGIFAHGQGFSLLQTIYGRGNAMYVVFLYGEESIIHVFASMCPMEA